MEAKPLMLVILGYRLPYGLGRILLQRLDPQILIGLLAWNGEIGSPLTLDITYENLNSLINNADALRIHVEGVFRPIVVSAPEPSSILGIAALASFPAFLKRNKKADNDKQS